MDPVTAGGLAYFALVVASLAAWAIARRRIPTRLALDPSVRGRRRGPPAWLARVDGAFPAVVLFVGAGTAVSLEVLCEPLLRGLVAWDLTPQVRALEGDAAASFQAALRAEWLDRGLVLVYIVGALVLYHAPLAWLAWKGRFESAWRYASTMALVWGVAILFYVAVPVTEAWAAGHPSAPTNVLFEQMPALRDAPGFANNIDNNFPSLHTGISVAVVAALAFSGERRLALLCAPLAAAVVVSTVYLGIHWWIDLVAGLALGIGGAWIAHHPRAIRLPTPARAPQAL